MPEVILKKFVFSILIGLACLCVGAIAIIAYGDKQLLFLSIAIFIGMVIKGELVYYRFKQGRYVIISGMVLSISRQLFSTHKDVDIETDDGIVKLYLPKETKLKADCRYNFYFFKDNRKTPVIINNYVTSKLTSDNFIGCEITDDSLPESLENDEV